MTCQVFSPKPCPRQTKTTRSGMRDQTYLVWEVNGPMFTGFEVEEPFLYFEENWGTKNILIPLFIYLIYLSFFMTHATTLARPSDHVQPHLHTHASACNYSCTSAERCATARLMCATAYPLAARNHGWASTKCVQLCLLFLRSTIIISRHKNKWKKKRKGNINKIPCLCHIDEI